MLALLTALLIAAFPSGCNRGPQKFTAGFDGVFDTYVTMTGYASSAKEFEKYFSILKDELERMSRLYDIYNSYDGINNLKTVNDKAGEAPVEVDGDIIDLLLFWKRLYEKTGERVNIAMGAVLSLWKHSREGALAGAPALPDEKRLLSEAAHCDPKALVIDEEKSTVYLSDGEMSLDVGAIAKGFAMDTASEKLKEAGLRSAIISAGGNVCAIGAPESGRDFWIVGVEKPEEPGDYIVRLKAKDTCVVTSGDYQRYFYVGGERYHHIIDPATLYPAKGFRSVTVVCEDSGLADMLSTALFIMTFEEGQKLAKKIKVEAIWVFENGDVVTTEGIPNADPA